MLLLVTILSCVGGRVFCYPPYSNDVYLRMALERAKDSAYPASWYDSPYDDYGYSVYDAIDEERPVSNVADTGEEQWQDRRRIIMDMEVDAYWPTNNVALGQVSGVAVDTDDNPVVFHRADHPWDPHYQLFDADNNFLAKDAGPIAIPTVLTLSKDDGALLDAWGQNKFYMPHGITVDEEGNIWLTDVALHQVFKYTPGSDEPSMVLGKEFEPAADGNDEERFCKPTDVAVSSSGHIFVADGYCNNRVVRFSADGKYEGQFGDDDLDVPHSLALAEDLDLLCVADRENRRILCYNAGLQDQSLFGRLEREYTDPMDSRVYAVEYNAKAGVLFAVNAPSYDTQGTGYTIDLHELTYTADIIDVWSPFNNGFTAPHDVTVSQDGASLYVGEITLRDINLWKFNDVAEQLENDDIDEQAADEEEEENDADEESEVESDENDEDGEESDEDEEIGEELFEENKNGETLQENESVLENDDAAEIFDSQENDEEIEDKEEDEEDNIEDEQQRIKEEVETDERMIDSGVPAGRSAVM